MARSFKPTLIALGFISLPICLLAFAVLYISDALTPVTVGLTLIGAPILAVLMVLYNLNHPAQYGVPSDERKRLDAEKYLNKDKDSDS